MCAEEVVHFWGSVSILKLGFGKSKTLSHARFSHKSACQPT
jgi:hypothetical protein